MATTLYLRNTTAADGRRAAAIFRGEPTNALDGAAEFWAPMQLSTARGASSAGSDATPTVAGPTPGQEIRYGSKHAEWISPPLAADVTISGTITFNLWAMESSMNANVAINAALWRLTPQGAFGAQLLQSAQTAELGTGFAPFNFNVLPSSTAFTKGDRLYLIVFGDDAGTMAAGFTFSLTFGGATPGSNGDSYVTFADTLSFYSADPDGTVLYPTNDAGPAVGANVIGGGR